LEVLQVAGNLLMSISQNERERAIFRSRRKFQTDLQSDLATAEDIGERRGLEQGLKQGLKQGLEQRSIEIARNLLGINLPLEQIAMATGLTDADVEELQRESMP